MNITFMKNQDAIIRRATVTDAESIASLYRQLVNDPRVNVIPRRIADISDDPKTALFVAESNGEVVGTAFVSLCPDVMFGYQPFAVVENIVVHSSFRCNGIGAALLSNIEDFCVVNDCSKIMLLSAADRERAHQFFQRMGFVGTVKRGFVKYRGGMQKRSEPV